MKTLADIPFNSQAKVLFENDRFFIIDKPAGLLSHPNEKDDEYQTAVISSTYDFKGEFYLVDLWKIFLLHRIDKETSGCLLFAKDSKSAKAVKADFENHQVHKEYVALLAGVVKQPTIWKDNLIKKAGHMVVNQQGKPNAITRVKPIEIFSKTRMTLTRFIPESGRTHQLRAQSSFRHVPILGDRQYGNFVKNKDAKQKLDLNRMFLHAKTIEFKDPADKKTIYVESPLPQDLHEVLTRLKAPK